MIYGRRATFSAKAYRAYVEIADHFHARERRILEDMIREAGHTPAEHRAEWVQWARWGGVTGIDEDGLPIRNLDLCEPEDADLVLLTIEQEGL